MNIAELKYEADLKVLAMVGSKELADKWWNSYNKYFGETPAETWKYDHDRVMMYLYTIDSYH